jgi:hypothetical protein
MTALGDTQKQTISRQQVRNRSRTGSRVARAGKLALGAIAGLLLFAPSAFAQPSNGNVCRGGNFVTNPSGPTHLPLAKVQGAGRVRFRVDPDLCQKKSGLCYEARTAGPGDLLITGERWGSLICAYSPEARTGGWIPAGRLAPAPKFSVPTLKDWEGHWRNDDDRLDIRITAGALAAVGIAYWPFKDAPATDRYRPQVSELHAVAKPRGDTVIFREGDADTACVVTLERLGPWIMGSDNNKCGGISARFLSIYQRK